MKPNLSNLFCEPRFQCHKKNLCLGNSLAVWWVGLGVFTAMAQVQSLVGSTKIQQAAQCSKKKKLCLTQHLKDFLLFSSRSFITLVLTPLHLGVDFCVCYEVRVKFFLFYSVLHMNIQLSHPHLLDKLLFPLNYLDIFVEN